MISVVVLLDDAVSVLGRKRKALATDIAGLYRSLPIRVAMLTFINANTTAQMEERCVKISILRFQTPSCSHKFETPSLFSDVLMFVASLAIPRGRLQPSITKSNSTTDSSGRAWRYFSELSPWLYLNSGHLVTELELSLRTRTRLMSVLLTAS